MSYDRYVLVLCDGQIFKLHRSWTRQSSVLLNPEVCRLRLPGDQSLMALTLHKTVWLRELKTELRLS